MKFISILFIAAIFIFGSVTSLDVSWIPSDPDGPLPLSAKYRDSLRKLCTLLQSGGTLPSEIQQKRHVLSKMCKKLAADDNNIASAGGGGLGLMLTSSIKKVIVIVVLGFGGFHLWENRRAILSLLKSLFKKVKKENLQQNLIDVQIAREARLKRFQKEVNLDEITSLPDKDL